MTKQSKACALHLANEPSELCFQARAQFLECVLRLKPEVIADLWNTVFPRFRLAVIRRFSKELLEGINDIDVYLKEKQRKYFEDPNSNYLHLLHRRLEGATGARPYLSLEQLSKQPELQGKVNEVLQRYVVAAYNAVIVKLIQSKLMSEFGVDPIRTAFHSYGQVFEREEDRALTRSIKEWSERSNLNAVWCHDHAVAVLREWLSHRQLSSVGLYTSEESMQRTGWSSAARELLYASIMSRLTADQTVYGIRGPKPLKFKLGNDEFEHEGFNRLRESQATYRQRVLIEFELWLGDTRRPVLVQLHHSNSEAGKVKIEPYYEILKRFTKSLNEHIRDSLKATRSSGVKLIKVKRKPSLANHVRWAVEFHVTPVRTLDDIAKFESCAEAVVGVLRDSSSKALTRDEICREFSCYEEWTDNDVDRALTLLVERGIVHTDPEDSTSRVIQALKAEGRDDLFGPDRSIEVQREAENEIRKRIEVDYEKTGGVVIVRYGLIAGKAVQEPNKSSISRAVKDILNLIDLGNDRSARGRSGHNKAHAVARAARAIG